MNQTTDLENPLVLKCFVSLRGIGRCFDYLPPEDWTNPIDELIGCRVGVTLIGKSRVAWVLEAGKSDVPIEKLRPISHVIDSIPSTSPAQMALLQWAAHYYHVSLGEALGALPSFWHQGKAIKPESHLFWTLTESGRTQGLDALKRDSLKKKAFEQLLFYGEFNESLVRALDIKRSTLNALRECGLVRLYEEVNIRAQVSMQNYQIPYPLNTDQEKINHALVTKGFEGFHAHLLDGVTGSGKTLIYLYWLNALLAHNPKAQILLMVPEIGLVDELLRFLSAFMHLPVLAYHSELKEVKRANIWHWINRSDPLVVVGTRSSLWLPWRNLSAIVVDEEHDSSYKQVEKNRFHARDLAVKLAQDVEIPILLGSATPSAQSFYNAKQGRFSYHHLATRARTDHMPKVGLVNAFTVCLENGWLAPQSLSAMKAQIELGHHVMVFINRRGYAPLLFCSNCRYNAPCPHCSMRMTAHQNRGHLICHACGFWQPLMKLCPSCQTPLVLLGTGTEKAQETLSRLFPGVPLYRIDRDTQDFEGFGWLNQKLHQHAENKQPAILIGTQMLAKGHNFPKLGLVLIVNVDQALFSSDPFITEQMIQTVVQVSGRSGRTFQGEALIQSHYVDHPLIKLLAQPLDYKACLDYILKERKQAHLAPFKRLALLTFSHREDQIARQKALEAERYLKKQDGADLSVFPMVPALLHRHRARYRWQILISGDFKQLHETLSAWQAYDLQNEKSFCYIDIDPISFLN